MVTTAMPARLRPVHARLRSLAGRFRRASGAARPVLENILSIPFTTCGIALFCYGVFTLSFTAGLMVTGCALIIYEHLVADE